MLRRRVPFRAAVTLALAAFLCPWRADALQLVSIEKLDLAPNQYVTSFEIETWAIEIVAVCRIPPGWQITAIESIDPGGRLAGSATGFVANIGENHLTNLKDLFLIAPPSPEVYQAPDVPPMFNGSVIVGTYDWDDHDEHTLPLNTSNLVMRPAKGCPPPSQN